MMLFLERLMMGRLPVDVGEGAIEIADSDPAVSWRRCGEGDEAAGGDKEAPGAGAGPDGAVRGHAQGAAGKGLCPSEYVFVHL